MSNSSRKNRNRPIAGTVQVIGAEMAAGYDPPSAALTPFVCEVHRPERGGGPCDGVVAFEVVTRSSDRKTVHSRERGCFVHAMAAADRAHAAGSIASVEVEPIPTNAIRQAAGLPDCPPDVAAASRATTPRSGRPIGLAPLIADALDELVPADGGPDGVPIGIMLEMHNCIGIPHSSVFNPVTEYVRKRVPGLGMVYTTATEVIAERGDIRARVTLPDHVADFLLTYDTTEHYPALVMQFGPAVVEVREEAAAA